MNGDIGVEAMRRHPKPDSKLDPDLVISGAVAALNSMQKQRRERGFAQEVDFEAFFREWQGKSNEEKLQLARKLAEIASKASAGPGPVAPGPEVSLLDYALTVAKQANQPDIFAHLATVVSAVASREGDEFIIPGEEQTYIITIPNPEGPSTQIEAKRPTYNPAKVVDLIDRMGKMNPTVIPPSASPAKP